MIRKLCLRLLAVLFVSTILQTSAQRLAECGDNWANFRGPSRQGEVEGANLPVTWSEEKNVVWKTVVEGKAWSSPVIWGDRIFLTNAPEDGSNLSIVCVAKDSGDIQFNKRLHSVALPQYCHPFNSYASCSPVVEEGCVYVSFGSPYNACIDSETGAVIWQRTDFVCNHFRGPGSSPFIYKELLILHFDGSDHQFIVALNKKTGEDVWRVERTVNFDDIDPATGKPEREGDWRKAYSTPTIMEIEGRPVLLSLGSMALYAYDPETGKELWRVEFVGSHSGAIRPVIAHGLIYQPMGAGGELWAIRPGGEGVLPEDHIVWKTKRAVPRRSSPVVVDDLLYMVDDAGVAACVEALTGETVWRERLGGNFSASLIHSSGRLYFFDQEGKGTVVKAGRKFEALATNHLDDGLMASPAVSGNAIYVRTPSHLYRIEAANASE